MSSRESSGEIALVDPNTRQGKRTPVTLKIKFKSETIEQFIERYAVDVSQGGIFIRTKEPLAVGTQMKFEFQLKDASPLIGGEGTVVWTREHDPSRPAIAPGMGVRFDRLADGSQQVLEMILAEKVKQAPNRGESVSMPPAFTDTPTRVAPAQVQEALLGSGPVGRAKTNEPRPVPFQSDADDFDEQAFEEATKVRSLDDLAAETAALDDHDPKHATKIMSPDELEQHRNEGADEDEPVAEPPTDEPPADERAATEPVAAAEASEPAPVDRESAPVLPSPPETRAPRLLDTTPSPRSAEMPAATPPVDEAAAAPDDNGSPASTRLGVEPARAGRPALAVDAARASSTGSESSHPVAPRRPNSAPIVIGILVVVAALVAAGWYFFIRPTLEESSTGSGSALGSATSATGGDEGSAMAGSDQGSAMAGSDQGSAAAPAGPLVDTEVVASVDGATVEVSGTDQQGPAPLTAHLEQGKKYQVHVSAPGYVTAELEIEGGQAKASAKLTAKPRTLTVTSTPAGARVLIDGVSSGKVTPAEIELTAAQSARAKLHVVLQKAGHRTLDLMLEAKSFKEEDARMVTSIEGTLAPLRRVTPRPPPTGSGDGSDTSKPDGATGSAGSGSTTTPPTGSGPTSPAGPAGPAGSGAAAKPATGSATPPAGGAATSGAKPAAGSGTSAATEPSPAWSH